MTVGADDAEAGHGPQEGVEGRRLRAEEIPSAVMGSSSLRDFVIWTGLDGMDEIRELNGILDEKYWDIVPDDIWQLLVVSFASCPVCCYAYRNCPHPCSWFITCASALLHPSHLRP